MSHRKYQVTYAEDCGDGSTVRTVVVNHSELLGFLADRFHDIYSTTPLVTVTLLDPAAQTPPKP